MSTFVKVEEGVYRWDGVDADHGFPIVGYVVAHDGRSLLIDPPATSGSAEEIRALGEPSEILITSRWHVRGAGIWKESFNIPICAPQTAEDELAASNTAADTFLDDGNERQGWRALRLSAGDGRYDELAFWHAGRRIVVIGDLITRSEEGLAYGPQVFSGVPAEELHPLTERLVALGPRLLLSAHIGPQTDPGKILESVMS